MNTYFIIGVVVVCMAAFASTEDPETAPTSREARLFGGLGGGWGWKPKRRPIETVFITYPKKGWGWQPKVQHGIHHYHTSGGHGGGGGGGGGWGWQPKVHVIPKHIHLPGGHFEEPGWGWEGWGHEQSYGHGGGWGWGQGGGHGGHSKKGHKKGGHGGGGHGGWGWQDPWQGGYERSDVSAELIEPGRHLEVEDSSEIEPLQPYADDAPFAYVPNYDQPEY